MHQGGATREMLGLRFMVVLAMLMTSLPTTLSQPNFYQGDEITTEAFVTGFADTVTCYNAMMSADTNGDRRISITEFPAFLQGMGPEGFLAGVDDFGDLPLTLSSTFHVLTCLCLQRGGNKQCCVGDNAHLDTTGTAPLEQPTVQQTSYLFQVCSLTASSVGLVINTNAPTPSNVDPAPVVVPTLAPSKRPTPLPTAALATVKPTPLPTMAPTAFVTSSPSASPTHRPTKSPSKFPTASPTTSSPTQSLSMSPTTSPSSPPIAQPSTSPSSSPTMAPTKSPTTPTRTPTVSVTSTPSLSPAGAPIERIDVFATITYSIVVDNGILDAISQADYESDLIDAMDILAVAVWSKIDFSNSTGGRRLRNGRNSIGGRRLEVRVQIPTSVDAINNTACPTGAANPETDRCEKVTASVGLFVDEEEPETVRQFYQASVISEIDSGRLQDALDTVNPSSPVSIVQGAARPAPPRVVGTDGGLSVGGKTGVAFATLTMVAFLVGLLVIRRGKGDNDKPAVAPLDDAPHLESSQDSAEYPSDNFLAKSDDETVLSGNAILGANRMEYGKSLGAAKQGLDSFDGENEKKEDIELPSNLSSNLSMASAGSSGWSSTYGSSVNSPTSESFDQSVSPRLSNWGAESGIIGQGFQRDPASLADLDNAIQTGDWAAVGTSAAFLAATSYDTASQSSQVNSVMSREKWKGALDAEKAAELDRLVEEGDWEGVVDAASRYEAELEINKAISLSGSRESGSADSRDADSASRESGSRESGSRESGSRESGSRESGSRESGSRESESSPSSPSSPSGSGAFKSASSETKTLQSGPTSFSGGSASKGRDREEIRREVVALVERVVPEEMEHVDEMMAQFRGREEELVETLRNMLERAIAQRARKSTNRQVKLDARNMARENRKKNEPEPDTSPGPQVPVAVDVEDEAKALQGQATISSVGESSATETKDAADNMGTSGTKNNEYGTLDSSDVSGYGGGASTGEIDIERQPPVADPPKATTDSGSSSTPSDMTSTWPETQGTKLEEADLQLLRHEAILSAIEAGDWEAVGEAAAILSDSDEATRPLTGTHEAARSVATAESSSGRRNRADLLTELIELGDWTRVVAVASQFTDADKEDSSMSNVNLGISEEEVRDAKRRRQIQEENDALEQAEMWMQIAQKSKQEGSAEGHPAEEAAHWAIAKSLSQMEKQIEKQDGKDHETRKNDDDNDAHDEGSV